jgi:hypothetical protein
MNKVFYVLITLIIIYLPGWSAEITSFKINSRLDFYSFEKNGEMLILIPPPLKGMSIEITMYIEDEAVGSWRGITRDKILGLDFPINLTPGNYNFRVDLFTAGSDGLKQKYSASAPLIILKYKANEVKIDHLTGGLIVNRRQFFPFGFFCYSPVPATLPEEEVVKGFNMISPYQKILPETIEERKKYMDRCARIGMKVHYNILSVSGGGGVGSNTEGLTDEQKKELLINEIRTFMDHPALLAWYIADEPNGYKVPPDYLLEMYSTVKKLDPWHPVSIVVMAPFLSGALKYSDAFDIVMPDPYPLPNLPAALVGNVTGQLKAEFSGKKAVWIAPQAFGGGEIWSREPTLQEMRSMTYQAIIKGATGIQYFVRQGPNYFPKSTAAWGECGRMAMEIAELTPWLLTDEDTQKVTSSSGNIIVTSRLHNNQLMIMAVNLKNEPAKVEYNFYQSFNGRARVVFENRSLPVKGGRINDYIAPFGSQVYMIDLKTGINAKYTSVKNLVRDPGFEDMASPGIPSACYARPGSDRGATYFLDTREHYEGTHSLRIVTPHYNKSMYLRFFPVQVRAGRSYIISLWAKSDPEQRNENIPGRQAYISKEKAIPQCVEIALNGFSTARFVPQKDWKKYITFVTIPADTVPELKANIILKMPGSGVAWFDLLEMIEDPMQEAETKADEEQGNL